ncbi:polysaccharide biosynthesis protein [Luteimonas sp. SJ-92]|uniref:Polysaccharide biosynthesis protein n=1 Tax=Luteimonas salinisoli TaxID=2752307 RepID=A0A853JFC9_9GAMM|nr:nucleoside-diphosphate sugar epimerase/dehydratase [Luteimonas salinisoli]NZA28016.1 polysaccharide biosynthesis protein [Luteimonas salinisoli]
MKRWKDRAAVAMPRAAIVGHDLFMVWLCWIGLHQFRLSMQPFAEPVPWWSVEFALILAAQGLVLWRVGLYRGVWRFASMPDLVNILKASLFGLFAIVLALFLYNRLDQVPRTVLVLYPVVLTALLGMPRLLYRSWKDYSLSRTDHTAVRVLILGAGQAGEALLRDLRRAGAYQVVGFLDDAAKLHGSHLQGVPVLGRVKDVARIAPETAARLLIIAMPSLDAAAMRHVVAACEETGLPFRTVPRLDDLLEGRSLPGELKEVAIEDLLGRQPVTPDWKSIRGWLGGRSVLVTGGGGSIGSELCRQCARHGARQIAVVEMDELALSTIEAQMRRDFPQIQCVPVLGDCGDPAVIRHALALSSPEAVFHAAAYKQVPVLEGQMREAVRNNVLATETVASETQAAGVATFVLISTDKAVDPVNVLGATKRLAEMVCQVKSDPQSTRFVTVRFGNVLDSAGSVVPLFREQIRSGGPVTVTDPEVTRYFMTIPESCQLILQAAAIGSRHAIYTLDMGEPVSIRLLAEQMIRLAGKHPERDVAIVYTGLRPGEKLHETLFHAEERYRPTAHPKILQAEAREIVTAQVLDATAALREAIATYDLDTMAGVLRETVPEFLPQQDPGEQAAATVVSFPARHARRT